MMKMQSMHFTWQDLLLVGPAQFISYRTNVHLSSSSLTLRVLWMPPILSHGSVCKKFLTSNRQTLAFGLAFTYVDLARQMFDENALKVAELEQHDNQPDTPTSAYPNLPGKYYCSRNGQYLHIIDWKGKDNEKPEGVLRVVIQSGKKRSQQLRFVKRGERFRMCSPENSSVLAIDCFGAWENLEFEVERDDAGVKAVSRQGMHLKDFFIRETP
jgi:hypothetical protein